MTVRKTVMRLTLIAVVTIVVAVGSERRASLIQTAHQVHAMSQEEPNGVSHEMPVECCLCFVI